MDATTELSKILELNKTKEELGHLRPDDSMRDEYHLKDLEFDSVSLEFLLFSKYLIVGSSMQHKKTEDHVLLKN
ncbi:hypothetical protein RRG08_026786 [Elysia crispata]|uniref:Uncharacterized protein n=1 Tax=Elysia crispata TaxID=231223 RepID=A0AAE1AQ89_9GAST|nr:hypothetical protein RRG08_026786 [Elysia crispata]